MIYRSVFASGAEFCLDSAQIDGEDVLISNLVNIKGSIFLIHKFYVLLIMSRSRATSIRSVPCLMAKLKKELKKSLSKLMPNSFA